MIVITTTGHTPLTIYVTSDGVDVQSTQQFLVGIAYIWGTLHIQITIIVTITGISTRIRMDT
jgi:hypothetical protein